MVSTENQFNLSLPIILDVPYQNISVEIIKQLRGERSQRQLSHDLGFSFNQVGKWESGVTQIKWHEFFQLCEVLRWPLKKSLSQLFLHGHEVGDSNSALEAIVRRFSSETVIDVQKEIGANPTLSQVLQKVATKSVYLFGWLSAFLDVQNISSLKVHFEAYKRNIEAVFADPIVVFVNAALHVDEYLKLEKHDDSVLAEHAACSVEQARDALRTLRKLEMISFDGQKYYANSFDFSFSGLALPKLRGLTKHTTVLAAERYPSAPLILDPQHHFNVSKSSVRVKAMSNEAAIQISELISKFHNEVDEILKTDKGPCTNVQIVLVHSFASTINSPFRQPQKTFID